MVLLILILTFIYIKLGLFTLIQIIILLIVLFASNFLIGINPDNKQFHIIRIMAVLTIILILYYNSGVINIKTMIVLPLSILKISYFDEFESIAYIDSSSKKESELINLFTSTEISKFLNSLDINDNYVATIEFTPEFPHYGLDLPRMLLSKPIMINRFSSPTTIAMFIHDRLNLMVDCFYLDDEIIQLNEYGPYVFIRCHKFYY
jgi:hypothetical protein